MWYIIKTLTQSIWPHKNVFQKEREKQSENSISQFSYKETKLKKDILPGIEIPELISETFTNFEKG